MNTQTEKYHDKLYSGLSKLADDGDIQFTLDKESFAKKLSDDDYVNKLHKGLSALSKKDKVKFTLSEREFKEKLINSVSAEPAPKKGLVSLIPDELKSIMPSSFKNKPEKRAEAQKQSLPGADSVITDEERSKLIVPTDDMKSAINADMKQAIADAPTLGESLVAFDENEFAEVAQEYDKVRDYAAQGIVAYDSDRYKKAVEDYERMKPIYDAKKKSENFMALKKQGLDAQEIYQAYMQEFNPEAYQRVETRPTFTNDIMEQKFQYEQDMAAYQHSGDALSIRMSELEAAIGPERFSEISRLADSMNENSVKLESLNKQYEEESDPSKKAQIASEFNALLSTVQVNIAKYDEMTSAEDVQEYSAVAEEAQNNAKKASEAMAKYPEYDKYYKENKLKQRGYDEFYKRSSITKRAGYMLGSITSNVVNKLLKDVSTLPQTLGGPVTDDYTWANAMADYSTFHLDNYLGEYGAGMAASKFKRGLFEHVAEVDGFQVITDGDGNVQSVRDKDGYQVGGKTSEAVSKKYNDNKKQYADKFVTNTDVLLPQTLRVVGDMGVMMFGAGKFTKLAAGLGASQARAQAIGLTGAVMGQTHNDAYNTAIQNGASNGEASMYAGAISASIALIAQINPQYFVFNKNATTNMLSQFEKAYFSGAPQRVLNREKFKSIIADGLKESVEETSEVPAEKIINGVFNEMTSGRMTLDEEHRLNEYLESAAVSFLPGAGFGTARHSNLSTMQQQLYVNAVNDPLEFDKALNNRVGKYNYIDGEFRKITAEDIKPIKEQIQKIRTRIQSDEQFRPLSKVEKEGVTVLEARKAVLEDAITRDKGGSKVIQDNNKKQIENIDKQIAKILTSPSNGYYEVDGNVMSKSEFMDWMNEPQNVIDALEGKSTFRIGNDTHAMNEWKKVSNNASNNLEQESEVEEGETKKKGYEFPGMTKTQSVKTKRGLIGVMERLFTSGDKRQAKAAAELSDRIISKAAEREGVTKAEMYEKIQYAKGNKETEAALRKANEKFQGGNAAIKLRGGGVLGFTYDTDMVARERFPMDELREKRISAGSDRVVFDLGDGNVLKVAKTARGLIQNAAESDFYLSERGLLPGAIEIGANYVIQPKYNPAKEGQKGFDELVEMIYEIRQEFDRNRGEFYSARRKGEYKGDKNSYLMGDYEFQRVLDKHGMLELLNYDVLWGDVFRFENWGLTEDGDAIHIDGGTFSGNLVDAINTGSVDEFTMQDFKDFKKRSMQAKEEFGDTDPYSQFQDPVNRNAQGATFVRDGKHIVVALTDPNVSTPLHELAHIFEHYLTESERKDIMEWAGDEKWTRETSEKFARGFEKYLADGNAPSKKLQPLFDKFKNWLTDIYNGIVGSSIDLELNSSMKDIYATMLGEDVVKAQGVKYTTEDGKFSLVKQDGKLRVRNNATGKVSATHPQTKALKEAYMKSTPELFTSGKMAQIEGANNEWDAIEKVIEESENPYEIAQTYNQVVQMRKADEDVSIEKAIAENLPRLKTTTFDEHGDRNWRKDAKQITLNYLSQDGMPLDQAALAIIGSNPAFENIPEDVMMNEILDFIKAHPGGTKSFNPKFQQEEQLEEKFEELTGFALDEDMASEVLSLPAPDAIAVQESKNTPTEPTSEVPFQESEVLFQDPDAVQNKNEENAGTEDVEPIGELSPSIKLLADGFIKAGRWWRKNFFARGLMLKDAFARMLKMNSSIRRDIRFTEYKMANLRRAIKEEIGEPTELQRKIMSDILRGVAKPSLLGNFPKTARLLSGMRADIDSLSKKMVKEGLVQGDVVATITGNLGLYVHRSYKIQDAPKNWINFLKNHKDGQKIFNKTLAWMKKEQESLPEDQRLSSEELKAELNAYLASYEGDGFSQSGNVGTKDVSILKHRKDIPKEFREFMGEYTDAPIEYMKTIQKMSRLIHNQRYLNDMKEMGLEAGWLSEKPIGDKVHQISPENESMYPLGNLYTTKDMKEALLEANKTVQAGEYFSRLYAKANGFVKYSKTVLSPMTHVRNFVSNTWFMVKNGYLRPNNVGKLALAMDKARKATWNDMMTKGGKEQQKYFLRLVELGVMYESPNAGDLNEIIKIATKTEGDLEQYFDESTKSFAKKAGSKFKSAAKKITELYQAEDNYWKIVAFEMEKQRYQKAYGDELTEAQIEEKAAEIVRNTIPTYSLVGKGIKSISKWFAVGTFVSFPAEVIRTTHQTLVLTKKEIADPKTRAIGYTRLSGMLATIGLSSLSVMLFRAWSGVDDEEDKARRTFMAPWSRSSQLIYLPGSDGERYIDLGYSDPFAYLKKPFVAFWKGETRKEKLFSFITEAFEPFFGPEILATAIVESFMNQKSSGGQVYNPEEPNGLKKVQDIAEHIGKSFEPGAITSGRRIYKGFMGQKTDWGKPYDATLEIVKNFTGQKVETFDSFTPIYSTSFKLGQASERIQNAKKLLTDVEKSKSGEYDEADKLKAKRTAEESLRNIINEYHKYYVDGNTLGAFSSGNFADLKKQDPSYEDVDDFFDLMVVKNNVPPVIAELIESGEAYRVYIDEDGIIDSYSDEQLKDMGVK